MTTQKTSDLKQSFETMMFSAFLQGKNDGNFHDWFDRNHSESATRFSSQAVEDYKEKLKAVFLEEPNGTVNLGRFLKLIDSIK